MNPRYLLDTHVLIRWLIEPKKLSREQTRVLRDAVHRRDTVAVSAISLLEIAVLFGKNGTHSRLGADTILEIVASNHAIQVAPLTIEIATEVAALGSSLRDPMDRAIVGTARVGRLTLVTSDRRIIDSELVRVVA